MVGHDTDREETNPNIQCSKSYTKIQITLINLSSLNVIPLIDRMLINS